MKEIFTNELLSILALLSCSSNIMQLVFYQSTKKRMEANAKSLALDVSKKEIKIQEADRESILKQLDDMMSRLISTQTEVQNSLLEVATLRAKLIMKDQEIGALTKERDMYKMKYEEATHEVAVLKNLIKQN